MFFAQTTRAGMLGFSMAVAALVLPGCSTSPKAPGTLVVSFSTKQGDENLFVWGVSLDGASPHTVNSTEVSGTFILDPVPAGDHHLILSSLPKACSSGADDRVVTVPSKDTVRVTISVKCTRLTGDILLSVLTSGVEFDADGYTVNVDGVAGPQAAASFSALVTLARLTPGPHEITLSGLASNCSVAASEPHTAMVVVDQAVTLAVNVACRTTSGTIRVVTTTNVSSTSDPDGYLLAVGTTSNIVAPQTGLTTVTVKPGTYDVKLSDIEPSCSVPSTTQSVPVAAGGTATINFDVTCGAYPASVAGVTVADPANDTLPNPANEAIPAFDILAVNTRYAPTYMSISLKMSKPIGTSFIRGFVDLDLDESQSTGVRPVMNDPLVGGTAPQGSDGYIYFESPNGALYASYSTDSASLINMIVDGDSIRFFIPLSKLRDDGNLTITAVIGTKVRPDDYAPNSGVVVSHVPAGVVALNSVAPFTGRRATAIPSAFLASKKLFWDRPQKK
jgi:hypothetical protein